MGERSSGLVLTLECVLDAPRQRIFSLLTSPGELMKWWGPHGFTTPEIELDTRVEGSYRFSMQPPDGDLFHLSGRFLEIDPPDRLVYSFRWDEPTADDQETIVTLSLAARGDSTMVSLSQGPFATEERLALHRDGWTDSFEKLRAVVASGS